MATDIPNGTEPAVFPYELGMYGGEFLGLYSSSSLIPLRRA